MALAGGNLQIVYGNGDGTFSEPILIDSSEIFRVAAADFNGDGRPDLVAEPEQFGLPLSAVNVYLNSGNGPYSKAQFPTITGFGNSSLGAADLNGDGYLDIYGGSTQILFGNGDGTFQANEPVFMGTSGLVLRPISIRMASSIC